MDKSDGTEKRFDKIDSQLDKIVSAVAKGFNDIDKALESKASSEDMQRILSLIDSFAKRLEISDDERLVMANQLTRLHDWVEKAAERIDLKFEH